MDEGLEGLVCRGRGRGINKGELEEHVERSIRVGGGGGGACLGGKGEQEIDRQREREKRKRNRSHRQTDRLAGTCGHLLRDTTANQDL